MTLTVFSCDDRGLYFVHEFGNQFVWFGEPLETASTGSFANVFWGERSGNTVVGSWFDIPKGRTRSSGILRLRVGAENNSMTRTNDPPESGGFGGRNWQLTTYRRPVTEPFVPAGFEGSGIADLTGLWMGDDGGIYYIRQQGNDLVWFGELFGRFSNVFRCTIPTGLRAGSVISGSWADVPKGGAGGNGTLSLQIRDAFTLIRQDATGGFGGTRWDRLSQAGRNVRLLTQNTYLMVRKFAVEARTPPALALTREYDIACLQEVMLEEPQKAFTDLTRINWNQTVNSVNGNQRRETAQVIDGRPNSKATRIMVGKIVRPSHPLSSRFYVLGPDSPGVRQDGGLLLISKFPITAVSAFVFSEARGQDRFANKGVIYAKVRLPGDNHIHVFNTHMQAGDPDNTTRLGTINSRQVRTKQLEELTRFVNRLVPDTRNERIVLMGDLNIIAPKPIDWGTGANVRPPASRRRPTNTRSAVPSPEYDDMLRILSLFRDSWISRAGNSNPGFTYIGKDWRTAPPSPWGSLGNALGDEEETDPQRLDYILASSLVNATNIALVPGQSPRREPVFTFTGTIGLGLRRRTIQSNTISDHLGVEMVIPFPL